MVNLNHKNRKSKGRGKTSGPNGQLLNSTKITKAEAPQSGRWPGSLFRDVAGAAFMDAVSTVASELKSGPWTTREKTDCEGSHRR